MQRHGDYAEMQKRREKNAETKETSAFWEGSEPQRMTRMQPPQELDGFEFGWIWTATRFPGALPVWLSLAFLAAYSGRSV